MAPEKAELSIQDIDLLGHLMDCSLSIWDIISFRACLKGRESSNNAWVISKLYLLFLEFSYTNSADPIVFFRPMPLNRINFEWPY